MPAEPSYVPVMSPPAALMTADPERRLVCERHRDTVSSPHPDQRWQKNVRCHHQRIRMQGKVCQRCGRRDNLTRHHDWADGTPGHPPRPVILCKRCHASIERPGGGVGRVFWWLRRL